MSRRSVRERRALGSPSLHDRVNARSAVGAEHGTNRLVAAGLWALVFVGTALLAYQRYHSATQGSVGVDFRSYVEAARALSAGHDPYSQMLVLYPPLLPLLMAPFSHASLVTQWRVWTGLTCAELCATAYVFGAIFWHRLGSWKRPILVGVAMVSILHWWPSTLQLFLGQADGLVLLVLALGLVAAERRYGAVSGALIGAAGLLKAWPAGYFCWFLRQGARNRIRSLSAFVAVVLLAPVTAMAMWGRSGAANLFDALWDHPGNAGLIQHSVWQTPKLLFTRSGLAKPVFVSRPLEVLATIVLGLLVLGLLAVCLRHPGDRVLAFWNVGFCMLLLMPVSHLAYTLYALPVLWCWVGRALEAGRPRLSELVPLAVVALWWIALLHTWPDSGSSPSISSLRYSVVFATDLIACAV